MTSLKHVLCRNMSKKLLDNSAVEQDYYLNRSAPGYLYLQVDVFLHHVFDNFQDFFPIISVREVWKQLLVINSAFLSIESIVKVHTS